MFYNYGLNSIPDTNMFCTGMSNPFAENSLFPSNNNQPLLDFNTYSYQPLFDFNMGMTPNLNLSNQSVTPSFDINNSLFNVYNNFFNTTSTLRSPTLGLPDYSQRFSERTGSTKFKYTASSQQIKRNAGSYFHKKGTYTPKRGDIAIWTKTADPAHGHVGIVTKVEGDTVWITEGNSGNRVRTNKYSISKDLMKNSGSRPFNGFIDAHSWVGSDVALKAAKRAEIEDAKGVVESNTRGGGSNDSVDIRRYKRGARNGNQWCAYFTSYCFTDGQNLSATA